MSANFVVKDLSRTPHGNGFFFSYSVKDGNNTVINASLLGAKDFELIRIGYTKNKKLIKDAARKAVLAACELQNEDGSWIYGLLPIQSWNRQFPYRIQFRCY